MLLSLKEHNKYIAIAVSGLLLFLGVFRFPIEPMDTFFEIMLEVIVSIALALLIMKKGNIFVGLFLLVVVKSEFVFYGKGTYMAFQYFLYGLVWYLVLVSLFRDKDIKYLMNVICLIAIASMFWMILQLNGVDPLFKPMNPSGWEGKQIPSGLMLSRFSVAGLFAFCVPAFMRGYWHFCLIPLLYLMTYTDCKAGFMAIIFAIYAYIFLQIKNYLWIGKRKIFTITYLSSGIISLVAFIFTRGLASFSARWEVWVQAWDLIKLKLLTGAGLGHWRLIADNPILKIDGKIFVHKFIQSLEGKWWVMHNEYWQSSFDMGILFIIVCLGFYVHACKKYNHKAIISYTALASMTIFSMAFFPFHNPITAGIGITWLAILHIQQKNKIKVEKPYYMSAAYSRRALIFQNKESLA